MSASVIDRLLVDLDHISCVLGLWVVLYICQSERRKIGALMAVPLPLDHDGNEVTPYTQELSLVDGGGTFYVSSLTYCTGIPDYNGTWSALLEDEYGEVVGEFPLSDCRIPESQAERCPFCGSDFVYVVDNSDGCYVKCGYCGARSGMHLHGCVKDALVSWNGVSRMVRAGNSTREYFSK